LTEGDPEETLRYKFSGIPPEKVGQSHSAPVTALYFVSLEIALLSLNLMHNGFPGGGAELVIT
jgi:hypothetical protein